MSFITWDDSLSVRVKEIDNQHQQLVRMINELHDAMSQGKGKDALAGIVSGLVSYAKSHFATEEKYFAQFAYPDKAAHVQEHKAFVDQIQDFKSKFDGGQAVLSLEVMDFLSQWLIKHIKGTDQKYSSFFNEKGLS
jgi:hemerythrin